MCLPIYFQSRHLQQICRKWERVDTVTGLHLQKYIIAYSSLNPLPHVTNLQQMTLKSSRGKYGKISVDESMFLEKSCKTMWQNEKLLIMTNFSFKVSHYVLESHLIQSGEG